MTTKAQSETAEEATQSATLEDAILRQVRALPVDRQQQVLDFAEFLRLKHPPERTGPDLYGALTHLGVHVTEEEIAEARREMWSNFPRELAE